MNIRPVFAIGILVLTLGSGRSVAALELDAGDCDVDSPYATRIDADRIAFSNEDTHTVVQLLANGRVEVDGHALSLSAADAAQVAEFERVVRGIVPEAKALAVDAVAIAFEAVGHASTAFAKNGHEARESARRIARSAEELQRSIQERDTWGPHADREIGRLIEGAVGSLVGEMVGNITAQAINVALSGDEAAIAELEARAESIEKTVEEAVEKRAREIEARADALCRRVQELDRIESKITARLPDGSAFDVVRLKRR
jgi:hypothetical protein